MVGGRIHNRVLMTAKAIMAVLSSYLWFKRVERTARDEVIVNLVQPNREGFIIKGHRGLKDIGLHVNAGAWTGRPTGWS